MLYKFLMDKAKPVFKPLLKAIDALGGQTETARVCTESTGRKIVQQNVFNWLNRDHNVPSDCAIAISLECKKRGADVPHQHLCPDYAWHLTEQLAAA